MRKTYRNFHCLRLLITVAVYQKITHKQDVLATLQKAEPAAVDFEEIGGTFPVYQLLDKNGDCSVMPLYPVLPDMAVRLRFSQPLIRME